MDRFKFRFWNTLRNKYEDTYCVGSNGITLDYVIPEQCTGLKDKNGKLIYEGDIVKETTDWEEYLKEVEWCDCGFNLNIRYDYEVIGNIHENPDLLGEE